MIAVRGAHSFDCVHFSDSDVVLMEVLMEVLDYF